MLSRQRKTNRGKASPFLFLGIFFILVFSFALPAFGAGFRDFFSPVLVSSNKVKLFFDGFGAKRLRALEDRNLLLEAKNSVLEARVHELESGIRSLSLAGEVQKTSSVVLSQAPASSYDTLVLSRGEGQDANVGDKVIAYEGIYVGEVIEVGNKTILARAISYPGLETEAWLESAKLGITLTGEGGYNLVFSVPKSVKVEVGDKVLSNTNPQLLIGSVERVREKPSEPLKEVRLRFNFNFRNLRYVELIH